MILRDELPNIGETGKANAPSRRRCTKTDDGCGASAVTAYSAGAGNGSNAASRTATKPEVCDAAICGGGKTF